MRPYWKRHQRGPVLCLYILEPSLWRQSRLCGSTLSLLARKSARPRFQLRACGASLELAVGEACEVLELV